MKRYYTKIIRIRAEDSPNVQLGLQQQRVGEEPTGELLVQGVLPWSEYCKRRTHWDKIRQCIGLDAEFWEGESTLLYPPEWLNRSEQIAEGLRGRRRVGKAIGIDPAEGGNMTSFVAVDEHGVIEVDSQQTPDTSIIPARTIAFGRKHGVGPRMWMFDRGGGGKQHADRLRAQGFPVRTVGFGETPARDLKRERRSFRDKVEEREDKYVYKSRRVQMYWGLRFHVERGFGIPAEYATLRQQLSVVPVVYEDGTGRIDLPPKHGGEMSLSSLIGGGSPDEADALVIAVYCMDHPPVTAIAGIVR